MKKEDFSIKVKIFHLTEEDRRKRRDKIIEALLRENNV